MVYNKGKGKCIEWIRNHADFSDDDCLIWPFSRVRGYGYFGYLGKSYYAHRYICGLVHGNPPTNAHEAAHSCGRGHDGCVNPRHLSWKTRSENQLDCRGHGTQVKSRHGIGGRVTPEQANQIRLLKGVKLQRQIAEEFNVSESTVSDIWLNRTHFRKRKKSAYTAQEDDKIREAVRRGYNFREMAEFVGRSYAGVSMRAYRIGLRSWLPLVPPHS